MIRGYVPKVEMISILLACHSSSIWGHHSGTQTTHNIMQCEYCWPAIHAFHEDTHDFVRACDQCQRHGGISWRHELPLTPILEVELFNVWGIDFIELLLKNICGKDIRSLFVIGVRINSLI